MDPVKRTVIAAVSGGAGLILFFSAFGRLRLWRIMGNTPTAKARSAPMGLAELAGLAVEEGPLLAGPLSATPCVWWRHKVEEERTRTNSKGETEYYWVTLSDERSSAPFHLKDPTGQVRIDPKGAEVDSSQQLERVQGRMRYTEWRIEAARPLYALGYLNDVSPAAGAEPRPTLGLGCNGEPFFLATKSEAEARRDVSWGIAGRLILGTLLFAVGVALLSGCLDGLDL